MKVRCKEDVDNFKKNVVYNCDEINRSYIVHNEKFNEATKYWSEEALKIEFEIIEEKESDDMEKYKIYEVLKMIEEDNTLEFKNRHGEIMKYKNYCVRFFKDNDNLDLYGIVLEDEWELIKQPVTFEEVLNSDKRCKVEHELIKKICETDISMDYEKFDNLMYFLSNCLNEGELKEIIKNGKWYLED